MRYTAMSIRERSTAPGWRPEGRIIRPALLRYGATLFSLSAPPPYIANRDFGKWADASDPDDWNLEGEGSVLRGETATPNGGFGLVVDATKGKTWLSQVPKTQLSQLECWFEAENFYRVSCWAKADCPGATIRLQSTKSWRDFAIAEHSGSSEWEYLWAAGAVDDEGSVFPARAKIEVCEGVIASFNDISVELL